MRIALAEIGSEHGFVILTTKPLVVEYIVKGLVKLAEEVVRDIRLVTHDARDGVLTNSNKSCDVFLIFNALAFVVTVSLYPFEGFSEDIIPFPHKSARLLLKYYNKPHQSAQVSK
jgi:hypothetical protein